MVPELLRKRGKPSRGPIVTTFHRNKKNYIIGTIISHRLLKPAKMKKTLYFCKKIIFIRTKDMKNWHLW